jgi:hypothetical protein
MQLFETAGAVFLAPESASSPPKMSGPLIATPGARPSRSVNAQSPLLPTPLNQRGEILTPTLYNGADWGTPSWGGEDAKMLQDFLAARVPPGLVAQSSAVTPGIMRGSSLRAGDAPPSIGQMHTPRVFFKDQLTETMNLKYQTETPPLAVSRIKDVSHRDAFVVLLFSLISGLYRKLRSQVQSPHLTSLLGSLQDQAVSVTEGTQTWKNEVSHSLL